MVRTLRFSLEDRMGITVNVMSPGFNMLVLHANFLYNRYQVRASGMTAFEDQMGRSYHGRLYQWAQPVMARLPAALEQSKMAARWMP
eukprot:3997956-Heterocapsa_arctica.AAC.1